MIVIDASVLVGVLLTSPDALEAVERVSEGRPEEPLHAPELIDVETLSALRRMVARGVVDDSRATKAVADKADVRMMRYPHAPMRSRVWELRENVTTYDATYLALAEALDGELLTADRGLASTARRSLGDAAVHLVA